MRKKITKTKENKYKQIIKKYVKNKYLRILLFMILTLSITYYNEVYLYTIESSTPIVIENKNIICVDGDTFKINDITIRLLAVDSPESVKVNTPIEPYAKEASEFTCNLILNAKSITFKQDKNNEYDKYDRLLAWVFVDDIFLQEQLVLNGFAKIEYISKSTVDKSLLKRLQKAENNAKLNQIGIWSSK